MKSLLLYSFLLLFALCSTSIALAQVDEDEPKGLVQFSGVVVAGQDLRPVPFTTIIITNTQRGTISDGLGFFSFVAQEKDSIQFSAIGYKKSIFVIPDSLGDGRYSLIQMMQTDTFLLQETVIYPWPSKENFKEAFLALQLPDDDLLRAQTNLEREYIRNKGLTLAMDGAENYRYLMAQQQQQLYTSGQAPANNLLNPGAWLKFIEAWKRGDFKKEED